MEHSTHVMAALPLLHIIMGILFQPTATELIVKPHCHCGCGEDLLTPYTPTRVWSTLGRIAQEQSPLCSLQIHGFTYKGDGRGHHPLLSIADDNPCSPAYTCGARLVLSLLISRKIFFYYFVLFLPVVKMLTLNSHDRQSRDL